MYTSNTFCIGFGRALSTKEEKDFVKTTKEAEKVLNIDNSTTLLKIYTTSMPSPLKSDTGQGKLSSPYTKEFLKTMSIYTGATAIKVMPNGKFDKNGKIDKYGNICHSIPYLRQALTLGEDTINIEELTTKEWGNIVNKNDFFELTENNKNSLTKNYIKQFSYTGTKVLDMEEVSKKLVDRNWLNYENEFGKNQDYPILKPLKGAYKNVMNPKNDVQLSLKKEFEEFKQKPINKFYERIAIASFMDKGEIPYNFFENFENSPQKQEQYKILKEKHSEDVDFFKFNQFIAKKQLQNVKKELNSEGKELWGDCQIGFGVDEINAFPDAFIKNASIGWGLPAIKYEEITDEKSEAHKLFKQKLEFFLENYDGIRFDVGWAYINPLIKHRDDEGNLIKTEHKSMDDKILNFIDKTAKEVKGEKFNTVKNLVYEGDAGYEDFHYIDENTKRLKPFLKNHTLVLTGQYQNLNGEGWNNPEFFDKTGLENYITGHNHDNQNLRLFSENYKDPNRENNIKVLSKLLHIPQETLQQPAEFVKGKFAELFISKNRHLMFYDVMGSKDILDCDNNSSETYRVRLNENWEKEFHTNLQNNNGFNLMEALCTAMKAKGKDKEYPELYKKADNFAQILREKGALTRQEADYNEKLTYNESNTEVNTHKTEQQMKHNQKFITKLANALSSIVNKNLS